MTTIDLRDAAHWVEGLKGKFIAGASQGLLSAALKGTRVIQTKIIPSRIPKPVDRGLYRAGWSAYRRGNDAYIENTVPHAAFVEFGVRAGNVKIGMKMILALAEWVKRKRLAGDMKQAMSIAWAVAKAAQKRGFFNRGHIGADGRIGGLQILGELVERHMNDIVIEEVNRQLNKVLK